MTTLNTMTTLNFNELLNSHFRELFYNQARFRIEYGGAGSGKSHAIAQKIIYRILTDNIRHRFLVLRKTNNSVRKSCYALLLEYLIKWNIPFEKKDLYLSLHTSEILFSGLDDPEKIKSIEGITGVWMEESSEFDESDLNQLNLRLRGDLGTYKQIILSFNPVGGKTSWLYKRFIEQELPDVSVHHSTWRDNKFIDDYYSQAIQSTNDSTFLAIYDRGEFATLKNQIYENVTIRDIDIDIHFSMVYAGVDFGFQDPCVCLLIGQKEDTIYILKEVYIKKVLTSSFIEHVKECLGDHRTADIYCDSAEPDRIQEMAEAGLNVYKANKSVLEGINFVKKYKIVIDSSCVNCCKEIPSYSYREDRNGVVLEEPVGLFDHCPDALRYAVYTANKNANIQLFV